MRTASTFKILIMIVGLSLALNMARAQQPTVINDSIYSNVLKEWRKIKIRLPEGYKPGDSTRYDVVYMIDGEWSYDVFHMIISLQRTRISFLR